MHQLNAERPITSFDVCVVAPEWRMILSENRCPLFGIMRYAAASSSFGSAFGFFSRFGAGPLVGLAPSVRISLIRTRVNSWRWPRLRREFLRRRFLNAITFGPRACDSTSAATEAPATV